MFIVTETVMPLPIRNTFTEAGLLTLGNCAIGKFVMNMFKLHKCIYNNMLINCNKLQLYNYVTISHTTSCILVRYTPVCIIYKLCTYERGPLTRYILYDSISMFVIITCQNKERYH